MKVGNTIYVNIGGYHVNFIYSHFTKGLNPLQAALDIMEKENSALVDRPRDIAAGEILGGGMRTLLARQGDRFKRIRKYIFSVSISAQFANCTIGQYSLNCPFV